MEIFHEVHDIAISTRTSVCKEGSSYFHWHENIEFVKPLTDGFKILIDGVLYETKKDDIIFIGEQCVHCFIFERDNIKILLGLTKKAPIKEALKVRYWSSVRVTLPRLMITSQL